ncbi:MAG: MarR family transcriptional regulator [Streptococcaceae bacterium]|jgi:DNA-binding MarR family transcriptional regulator|nr:MarR family transcriptional regulator [Streptococcaceae bacterium]
MSEQTNHLLSLFGRLLHDPRFMMGLRMEQMSRKFQQRGARTGARGLLVLLWEKDGLSNAEIAEKLDIRPSSVTSQVKILEEKGFAERRVDENDARSSRVFLTEIGREQQTKKTERHTGVSEEIFGTLSSDEQNQLSILLEKLVNTGNYDDEWTAPDFDPREFRRVMTDMHRSAHDMKNEFRRAWREAKDEDWGMGSRRPERGIPRTDKDDWTDF